MCVCVCFILKKPDFLLDRRWAVTDEFSSAGKSQRWAMTVDFPSMIFPSSAALALLLVHVWQCSGTWVGTVGIPKCWQEWCEHVVQLAAPQCRTLASQSWRGEKTIPKTQTHLSIIIRYTHSMNMSLFTHTVGKKSWIWTSHHQHETSETSSLSKSSSTEDHGLGVYSRLAWGWGCGLGLGVWPGPGGVVRAWGRGLELGACFHSFKQL